MQEKHVIKMLIINIMNQLLSLPQEIREHIFKYIPPRDLIFLNKKYYSYYHRLLHENMVKARFENYIRFIIKKDLSYCFELVLKENKASWSKRSVFYRKVKEPYFNHINLMCIRNKAQKCRKILKNEINIK